MRICAPSGRMAMNNWSGGGSRLHPSVPYFAGEFGEPVAFTCGALPEMLSDARMLNEVGPALRDVVRDLELKTGRSSALARRG